MVVLVFIISCQVSLKPSSGPLSAHTTKIARAAANTQAWPIALDTELVKRVKISSFFAVAITLFCRKPILAAVRFQTV
jgi:hypothetical protein